MKTARLLRWSGSVLSPRTRPTTTHRICISTNQIRRRQQSTATATIELLDADETNSQIIPEEVLTKLPSPPVNAAKTSAQLAALHGRLNLPSKLPIESLARTLVDPSADPNTRFNNNAFSLLGADLLSYYTSEFILCRYPRLPLAAVFAAMQAYCGPKALGAITREWGVKSAAEPGGEVDAGYLQFKHVPPGDKQPLPMDRFITTKPPPNETPDETSNETANERHRKNPIHYSLNSRIMHNDPFGEKQSHDAKAARMQGATLEDASAQFVRAVVGAVYMHAGRSATKAFFKDHFMSRSLNMAALMSFPTATQDLSKVCRREGFETPVARILSETGRLSRHPVFIVGIFSGKDKLGEGAGGSLDEARTRAAVAALKGWYLYSPLDWRLPSDIEEPGAKPWTSQHVDIGEVVF